MSTGQAVGEPQPQPAGSPAPDGPAAAADDQQQRQEAYGAAAGPLEVAGGAAAAAGEQAAADGGTAVSTEALAAQLQAQLAALEALGMGLVAPESTVLMACGGRIPAAAVSPDPCGQPCRAVASQPAC